jgi:hypothetical protein
MKSVSGTLFFKPMKEEPTVFPFGPFAEMIVVPKRPYRPSEKCLDKSTGEVVTIVSCEPMRVEDVTREDCARLDREHLIDTSLAYNEYPLNYQQTAFRDQWRKRHPGKEWAWRVESEEEVIGTN